MAPEGETMKICVIDSWGKFMRGPVDHWRALGHEVRVEKHWAPERIEGMDIVYFYPVEANLIHAARTPKPPGTRIVAEAVDIDIYSGHSGAVNWDYVDALIVMAPHMLELLHHKVKNLPSTLPIHIVPGGVDLERFTLVERPRNYNVAWIGRKWIAKNLFGALQIFNQLIQADPEHPWRLWCLGQRWHPEWWQRHCEAYLEANSALVERVEFVDHVPDVNEWLENMSYLLQTSFKEAFGYCIAEAAAKGIRPVVQNTNGALATWPREWVFDTHAEAIEMLTNGYDARQVRGIIEKRYPLAKRLKMLDCIIGI